MEPGTSAAAPLSNPVVVRSCTKRCRSMQQRAAGQRSAARSMQCYTAGAELCCARCVSALATRVHGGRGQPQQALSSQPTSDVQTSQRSHQTLPFAPQVGNLFAERYYKVWNAAPLLLYRFYNEESTVSIHTVDDKGLPHAERAAGVAVRLRQGGRLGGQSSAKI